MSKLLWVFSFLFPLYLFSNEQFTEVPDVCSTEGLPSNIVNNTVCVISGEYTESTVDVIVPGPEPLVFGRSYANKTHLLWTFNHMDKLHVGNVEEDETPMVVTRLFLPSGSAIDYSHPNRSRDRKLDTMFCTLRSHKGLTNGASCLSGRTNLKNQVVHYRPDKDHMKIVNGAGDESFFKSAEKGSAYFSQTVLKKINGSTYRYNMNTNGMGGLSEIICGNRKENTAFSSILLLKMPKHRKERGVTIVTSDERYVNYYTFEHEKNRNDKYSMPDWYEVTYLGKVEPTFAPWTNYLYDKKHGSDDLQIVEKQHPNYRYLITEYYKKGDNFVGGPAGLVEIKHHDDYRLNRVKRQKAPVGHDKNSHVTHRFVYNCKTKKHHSREETFEGTTDVYDAHDHKTTYAYDKHHRLETITRFSGKKDYAPYLQECFKWGKGSNDGNLVGKIIKDKEGNVHHARYFEYDSRGNVTKSELCGKLTGLPAPDLIVKEDLSPGNTGYEKEVKTYTYSNDHRNLVLTETDSNGKVVVYDYIKDTDHVKAKWILYDGCIRLREFYTYDDNYVVIKKVTDDGTARDYSDLTGVTERHYTYITPRTEIPFGLPAKIEEKYLDLKTGIKIPLQSQRFHYSKQGKLLHHVFYDSNGTIANALHWEYDTHGNVTKEVNALGETTIKKYDENENLIYQQGPSKEFHIENEYDYVNRLICQREVHTDGKCFATHYKYDRLSNCIAIIDTYGRETKQTYDEFGRIIKIKSPAVLNESGEVVKPTIFKEYNAAGHPICITDPKGRQIHTEYNSRGQPLCITYPDGSTEKFLYRLDGQLLVKIEKNGVQNRYQRDTLGRVINEKVLSPDGVVLKEKKHTYNALHLLSTIDEAGLQTTYHYDAAGRISLIVQGEKVQQFLYDTMGRMNETREWYGNQFHEYRATIKVFDVLNREIEERIEDAFGNVIHFSCCTYDERGNKIKVQNGDQITITEYDSHNAPITIINADGQKSKTTYNYACVDETGQNVLQTTTTDPLGYQTIDTYDAADRLVKIERKTPFGQLVAKQATFYDICGNKGRVRQYVFEEGEFKKFIESEFIYSEMDQLIATIEASRTAEQKITRFQYNSLGQKISETKHSGMSLLYDYDTLGRLKTLTASDGSIYYHYEYDKRDQPTQVIDLLTGQITKRTYDLYGQLIQEKLGNGLTLSYSYDKLDRPRYVLLPDQTGYEYVYNAVDLKEVHRIKGGARQYSHYNQAHSPTGKVTHAVFAGGTEGRYTYDLLSRCTSILTPHFQQTIPKGGFDAAGNLCHFVSDNLPYHYAYDHLYQIKEENGHEDHSYQFDSINNRVQKDGEKHLNNYLNQLVKKGETLFSYDQNGNLAERHENIPTKYTYDALDRLISVAKGNEETSYSYDPFNRRLSKKQGAEEQLFLYHGQEEIGLWQDGRLKEFRLLGNNKRNPMIAIELEGTLYIPIHDFSGNVVCLQDHLGNLIERYRYTAFGESEILAPDGSPREHSSVNNPWQYASKRFDPESQLVNFGLRYYIPDLGRWLTPDPLGSEDGPNLYAYVKNSPLNYYDQFGLFAITPLYDPSKESFNNTYDPTKFLPIESRMRAEKLNERDLMNKIDPLNTSETNKFYSDFLHMPETFTVNELGINNPKTNTPYVFKEPPPNLFYGFVCGICNKIEEFKTSLIHIANLTDCNGTGIYSPTYGFLNDLIRCVHARQFIRSETVDEIHKYWYSILADPEARIFWICHSRGAIDTRNALLSFPPELRERIEVLAIAPGAFIDKHLCGNITHIVSRDFVPYSDYEGMKRCYDTIEFVKPHRSLGIFKKAWDHSIMNRTYAKIIAGHFDNFIRKYS